MDYSIFLWHSYEGICALENGVQKLVAAVDGDISGLITQVKVTVDVSKTYPSFSGLSEDMGGQAAFFYRTEAIDTK